MKFAFIAHTFEMDNFKTAAPTLFRKGRKGAELTAKNTPPGEMAKVTNLRGYQSDTEGWILSTWLFPNQYYELPSNVVLKRIVDTAIIGKKLGADIVGLGGFNSIVPPGSGRIVAKNLQIGVTNGNSFTIASSIMATKLAACKMGVDFSKASIAIVGATGSIGKVISSMVCRENKNVVIVGTNEDRLIGRQKAILNETGYKPEYSTDLREGVGRADIIFSATNRVDPIIQPDYIKPGAILCDVALPHDASVELAGRNDVLVLEGGVVQPPSGYIVKPDISKDLKLLHGTAYACFCETAILALEKYSSDFSLDNISIKNVEMIQQMADKHGFVVTRLKGRDSFFTDSQIEEIKKFKVK